MFKWKDSYSVNVQAIDEQHKRLFELALKIYDVLSVKDSHDHFDEIMKIVDELKEYTIYHFNYEEELMERCGFENIEEHKLEHKAFIQKVSSFNERDIDEKQSKVIMEMIMFVADWIEKHILKSDHRYKELLNSNGIY